MEGHRMAADRMAGRRQDQLARAQPLAQQERRGQIRRGAAARQPVLQQPGQRHIAQAQPRGQRRQRQARRLLGRRLGAAGLGQAAEHQPRRRRIGLEGAHRLDPADLQRLQALAQRRLQRAFPARLDLQPGPQRRQPVQAVTRQPGRQPATALHLLLQRTQRVELGGQLGAARLLLAGELLRGAALLLQLGQLFGQRGQPLLGLNLQIAGLVELCLQQRQPLGIRRGELAPLGAEALSAQLKLAAALVEVARLRRQQLDLLLHAGGAGPLGAGLLRGLAQPVLGGGQRLGLFFQLRGQHRGLLLGLDLAPGQVFELRLGLGLTLDPLRGLGLRLHQPLLAAPARVGHMTDALLQAADLHRRLGQTALGDMQRVVRFMVRLAQRLQRRLGAAQLGQTRLQRVGRRQHRLVHPLLLAGGIAVLQEPELVQLERAGLLQVAEALRHLRLRLELLEVGVKLAQDVLDPGQVLAGVLQAVLGLAAALLVLGDARGLLQEQAQLLGARLDDAADRALADDGVGARAQTGAQEHVLHIAPAHRLAVDVVLAGAVAGQHPAHRDLGVLVPLAAGARRRVVEDQLDAGAGGGLALPGAVEDHVLHRLAAQLAGLALAQHPAHRVHDVGLAAAVGADHAHQLPGQLEMGRIGKGLEARELDRIQAHRPQVFDLKVIFPQASITGRAR